MRFLSPNGSPIVGTYEVVYARADATDYEADGTPNHDGYTEVFWDTQKTVTRGGEIVYLDEDGEEWVFSDLIPDDDDEEEDE